MRENPTWYLGKYHFPEHFKHTEIITKVFFFFPKLTGNAYNSVQVT